MKKIVFYLPAILFTAFYGWIMIGVRLTVSPIIYAWVALLIISGVLLSKEKAWGGFFGVIPGIYMIYMSTKNTGQIINIELLLGIIVVAFYLLCCGYIYLKKRKATE